MRFHDLRQTFDTMILTGSYGVGPVASCLGFPSVCMTLDIYAELCHYATSAAVSKLKEGSKSRRAAKEAHLWTASVAGTTAPSLSVEQPRAVLAAAEDPDSSRSFFEPI